MALGDTGQVPKRRDELVLHLIWTEWEGAPCLVSPATLDAAQRATADDAPHPPMNFGDVRRSADLDQLKELLEDHGNASLKQYVVGIESVAGQSGDGDIATRLASLHGFDFRGDDTATDDYEYLPGDDVDFREEQVAWDEPEVRYWDVIARATSGDLPADLAAEYCSDYHATGSPGSSGAYIGSWVDAARLDELIVEIEARGYTVNRGDETSRR